MTNAFIRRSAAPLLLILLLSGCAATTGQTGGEAGRWRQQADRVVITRDEWGIAHVRGRSDADAVFGMVYAQAEDDFNRIETNYLTALGRLAEAEGARAIWQDLRTRLYLREENLQRLYGSSPPWLQRLMQAWADGLNHYLATHPEVKPRALTRFEPWMALSFTEGSIGNDIERIPLAPLREFYEKGAALAAAPALLGTREPTGSNGIAIAPARTENGKALLLINPHTSFFFRSELQMTSEEGLNAYGAATWGQFFIYQGFNDRAGWMHTTSGLDVVDEFREAVERKGDRWVYHYGTDTRPVETRDVTIQVKQADGSLQPRTFTTFHTHRGPIIRRDGDRWISFAMMHKPVEALSQSFLRTKARNLGEFLRVAELKANSSNNTIFADSEGNIAYLHPQFIPRRNARFDYSAPVDGTDPSTDWGELHALEEAPRVINPGIGWIQNTNNWPYSAAGPESPKPENFPAYMDQFGENPRGLNAVTLLSQANRFSLRGLEQAAFSQRLPAFDILIPPLLRAYDGSPRRDGTPRTMAEQVAMLRSWDRRWSVDSEATSLAVFWGEALLKRVSGGRWGQGLSSYEAMAALPAADLMAALAEASATLQRDFGRWRVPWGEINRFQRVNGAIVQPFSDALPSIPVGFTSARWGSLASFGARAYPGTKKWYGTGGNSFVAVVEFGDRVKARAVTAGGESGDPSSPHFNDQAELYAAGRLRDVHFHPDEIAAFARRVYRPGLR